MISLFTVLMALFIGLASCQAATERPEGASEVAWEHNTNASISGTITYRERIALSSDATALFELRDVSLADAPAPLIASQTIHNPGQVPIKFKVPYNRDDIEPRRTYGITARIIESDGHLAFINDTAYDVITRGNPNRVDMLLVLVQPPSDGEWEGKEDGADWRTWVEVPAPVVSANLIPNEREPFLRVVYLQSTIEGCARSGNQAGALDGSDINVSITLMQPPQSSWAIPCDDELVELDGVLPIRAPLKPGTTYRVVVNGIETTSFTPPGPALGHTVIADSLVQRAEVEEAPGDPGSYLLRVVSGRPSGSCTRYNGYETIRREPAHIEVRLTHHEVADPDIICTADFPTEETVIPLGPDFEPGDEDLITVNGKPLSSYR